MPYVSRHVGPLTEADLAEFAEADRAHTSEEHAMNDLLTNGAVLTKRGSIVNLELDGDCSLFFMSRDRFGHTDTDRADFLSKEDRDAALIRTVGLYEADGWTRVEG